MTEAPKYVVIAISKTREGEALASWADADDIEGVRRMKDLGRNFGAKIVHAEPKPGTTRRQVLETALGMAERWT